MTNKVSEGGDAIRRENARVESNRARREPRNPTPIELAMAAARQYKELAYRQGSNHAQCLQLVDDIRGWVGYNVDGKILIPDAVRAEMGLPPNKQ